MIPKGSIFIKDISSKFVVIYKRTNKQIRYAIDKDSIFQFINIEITKKNNKIEVYGCKKIKGKHISIIEWNAFSIYAVQNQFIINSFLEKHKPDFILLNELGIKGNNKLNLHDNYNIIEK